jgi:hypothetical protein
VTFQELDLRFRQHDRVALRFTLEPHEPLVPRLDAVPRPHPAHARWAYFDGLQAKFVRDPLCTVCRPAQRVIEDLLLDLSAYPVRVRVLRSAPFLHQRSHASDLEGAAHLVERVAVIAHELAGLGHVAELLGQLQQR